MLRGRKGAAVPVVIFVVLAIVLLIFSLAVFGYAAVNFVREIGKGYSGVADYNIGKDNQDFLEESGFYKGVSIKAGTYAGLSEGYLDVFVGDLRMTSSTP